VSKPHGRKTVVVLAGAALAIATGWVSVSVIGSASAAEGDRHPLAIQRVYGDDRQTLVGSVIFSDNDAASDRWCINLKGDLNSWTDADASVRVREGHKYKILGFNNQDCTGGGYGQPGSPDAVPPIGMSTDKFWYTPTFIG
jgi:hypothetical protein